MDAAKARRAEFCKAGVYASFSAALVSVLATAVMLAPGTAIAKPLGVEADSGDQPTVLHLSDGLPRPKSLRIAISASPEAPLQGNYWVSCRRGFDHIHRAEFTVTKPGTYHVKTVMRHPDACRVISVVTYATADQSGNLRTRVWGLQQKRRSSAKPHVRAAGSAVPRATSPSCAPAPFMNQLQALATAVYDLSTDPSWQSEINDTVLPQASNLLDNSFSGETLFKVDAPYVISQFETLKSRFVSASETVYPGGDMDDTQMDVLLAERPLVYLEEAFHLTSNPDINPNDVTGNGQVTRKFASLFQQMNQDYNDVLFLEQTLQQDNGGTWPSADNIPDPQAFADELLAFLPQVVDPVMESGFAGQTLLGAAAGDVFAGFNQTHRNLRNAAGASSFPEAAPFIRAATDAALSLYSTFQPYACPAPGSAAR